MHYWILALIDKADIENADEIVAEMMEPYNENMAVEEYEEPCWACKSDVRQKATAKAEKELKITFEQLHKKREKKYKLKELTLGEKDEWHEKTYGPLQKLVAEYITKINKTYKAKKACECKGTGLLSTTYNEESKWDWYVIGGRYDGLIQDRYDERSDGEGGFNFGNEHHSVKHNIISVKKLIGEKTTPYGFITKEGWKDRVISYDPYLQYDDKTWIDQCEKIYNQNKESVAIGLDCHN